MQILSLNLYLCRIQEALGPLVESWNFWVVPHIKTKSVSTLPTECFTFWSLCILWSLTQKALSHVSAKMKTGDPIQAPWIPAQARGNSFDAAPCPLLKMLDFARL